MEFPAASVHRGLVPLLGLLLAVFPSSLTIWIPPTPMQLALVSTSAVEGQDVILRIRNSPPEFIAFMWYRGIEMKNSNLIGIFTLDSGHYTIGPRYSGRETANPNGTLTIRNVTPRDQGLYMVVALLPNFQTILASGSLSVYEPVSVPILIASNTTVTENEDAVVMTCYSSVRFTNWLFNGTSLQFNERMKLSKGQVTLTIDPVKREDAGNYQCKVSNPISSFESEPVELDVKY